MEGFELFNNNAVGRVVDKITITRNYSINFPSAFYKKNDLYGKKTALLYYNKTTNQLAIEFKSDDDTRGFKITAPHDGKNGGYITAKNFFKMNNLDEVIQTGRYDYRHMEGNNGIDKEQLFVIDLKHDTMNDNVSK